MPQKHDFPELSNKWSEDFVTLFSLTFVQNPLIFSDFFYKKWKTHLGTHGWLRKSVNLNV